MLRPRMVKLYLYFPKCLYGIGLNSLSTGTTLTFLPIRNTCDKALKNMGAEMFQDSFKYSCEELYLQGYNAL
jgi:hypothetical protein